MTNAVTESLTEREADVLAGLAAGLSNHEIADKLFLSPSTVKRYVRQLNSKFDTTNREEIVERAHDLGLLDDEKPPPAPIKHNLPYQTTPFVGRDAELDELHTLLTNPDIRLLTILAPGGMGKTRIALEAAEQQLFNFKSGVFFVPLQPLSDVEQIIPQMATSTGYQFQADDQRTPKQQLLDYLANKTMLLVIDNWEHLLDGAALLSEILQPHALSVILASTFAEFNLIT